jgi:phytoene dehydrogenase-like protein
MTKQYDYDAIIIGAGISGLICGCYLAKAGLKTLIVEKMLSPGDTARHLIGVDIFLMLVRMGCLV